MKKLVIGLCLLAVMVAVGLTFRPDKEEQGLRQRLEAVGSTLLGVPVTVEGVDVNLKAGSVEITGLHVANPEGYPSGVAVNMPLLRITLDPQSVTGQPLVLDEVTIESPVIRLALNPNGSNNLQQLQNNSEWNAGGANRTEATRRESGETIRIAIQHLAMTGASFEVEQHPQTTSPGSGTLPAISMTSLGGDKGVTPADLGRAILGELAVQTLQQALQDQPGQAQEQQARELLQGLGGMIGKPAEEAGQGKSP